MSKEHRIYSVLDMLKLTRDEFERMLPDLYAWFLFAKEAEKLGAENTGFRWVDDGKAGEVRSVIATIKETGAVKVLKGSAYEEPT